MNKKLTVIPIVFLLVATQLVFASSINTDSNGKIKIDLKSNDLPSSFSWTDKDGVDYTTPIRRQMPYASCESFAFVAAIETMVQYKLGFSFNCDLSEAHLFFHSDGNIAWGSYPENDTNYLVEHGVPDEACWPYPTDKKQYPKNTTCDCWEERAVKIKSWDFLPPNNITAIKEALVNNGPVPVHFNVYEDFGYYLNGIYRHRWGESVALHCVCIMGYKDDPRITGGGYWIVKNSWGKKWGDNGWFRVAYGEASIEQMPIIFGEVYGNFPVVYVDDDNTMGPWDGSEEYPYQTISSGIDNAYNGWAVYVKNGTYYENIKINKTVTLVGENSKNTIIDGEHKKNVTYVNASGVKITGFTIKNSGPSMKYAGIRTVNLEPNLVVEDCIIKDNYYGIYLNCADYWSYPETGNLITNNIIENNVEGIRAFWVHNNEIIDNVISNNSENGIFMESGKFSKIENNSISDNQEKGIYLHGGSSETKILDNKIINNSYGLLLEETNDCKIKNNFFIENGVQAGFYRSRGNRWFGNYWSDWQRILPRPIKGTLNLFRIPWYNFDWRPLILYK